MEDKTTQEATTAPVATEVATTEAPKKQRRNKRSVPHAQVHVFASFNNTIITLTDLNGGVLAATSAGACGFRGSKKGTAYAVPL